ncbi:NERD domain-containing protein/DEAD/DEAH box helicase [Desulfurispirillum indicum]|uniref:nuclease-related domain-containing DEAD/DEAH box helicase n=1 Tax=Desulfurispirillum indicum TaxID=936456 RepID=UPI001CFA97F7|nr:NERD domain-containing protein/DEAD/DEAH box helicase [Desulfurispirillum indicum]UCZ57120.1 NERD domain-containing protein/DEAD/DEAH box helicase [Desulfurispirillum indicum]
MALIYPALTAEELQSLERHSRAEARVYRALEKLHMPDLEVYHSLTYRGQDGFGEMDFVLLHPRHGMMIWEVKGGGVSRREGRWYSIDRHGNEHSIHDPLAQLGRAQGALVNQINQQINRPGQNPLLVPVGRHLVFPDMEEAGVKQGLGSGVERADLMIGADLENLTQEALIALFERTSNFRDRLPIHPGHLRQLQERVLRPQFRLLPGLEHAHTQADRKLIRLSAQQSWALRMLEHIPRVMIDGGAGTGKSLLACEKARQLATQGKRTLLLCYNIALGNSLRERLSEFENIWVGTYHDFCQEQVRAAGLEWDIPTEPKEIAEFYLESAPELLDQALRVNPQSFDALIVDEAQDFATHWWLPLVDMLSNEAPVYIFSDPNQNVFGRDWERPYTCFHGMIPYPFQLLHNVRNSREIARWLKDRFHYAGDPMEEAPDAGLGVVEHRYRDDEEQVTLMIKAISQLKQAGIPEEEIVILSLYRAEKSNGYNGLLQRQPFAGRFSTISAFKGLHAKAILLCDWNTSDHARREDLLYVGASRAQMVLHLFRKAT